MTVPAITSINPLRFHPLSKLTRVKQHRIDTFAAEWFAAQNITDKVLFAEFIAAFETAICLHFKARVEFKHSDLVDLVTANGFSVFAIGPRGRSWLWARRVQS